MSDATQKEFFDQKIAEHCRVMRLLSLKISDSSLQMEALRINHASLVQAYANQQAELQQVVSMAHKMLGLEGEWICAIDTGELKQLRKAEGTGKSPQESEDPGS